MTSLVLWYLKGKSKGRFIRATIQMFTIAFVFVSLEMGSNKTMRNLYLSEDFLLNKVSLHFPILPYSRSVNI